jgi:long-chain acyl-CoA synthetase
VKLPDFIAAFARATPRREAIACDGVRLSFGELHEQSTRIALGLAGRGVQVGDRVAICLTNRVEFVVGFLACIKAGAIAVTLNPRYAAAELAYMLADSAAKAVLFEDETRAAVTRSGAQVPLRVTCDKPLEPGEVSYEALLKSEGRLPDVPPEFDDCQIQYTSGTTGQAKGAIITQANYIVANGYCNIWLWGMTAADRVLTTTPLAHRTAFSRLMNTFTIGSSIVIMKRFDAKEAARLVEAEGITLLGMVPTVGRMLLPEIEANPSRFRNLRLAVVTGEAFPVEVKRRLAAALPHLKLVSFFAMTEMGALTCLGPDPAEQVAKAASVGRVVPGVEVKLVDEQGHEVKPGEAGEIAVRSGVPGTFVTMRAYFNKPEATAEAIRNGWVHTGDMGRFDEDGYLYIVDRKKDMVLSGGYNIYSKEVESAILEIAGVQDVAVVGVPDEMYGESVAAFIELGAGARLDAEQVVAHCREKMASYKKPKHVRFVEALPRNSSGKVLKFQLREQFK